MPSDRDPAFRVFPRFNQPELKRAARVKQRFRHHAAEIFDGAGLPDRFARALAARDAVTLKELLESFEFWARVRRRVRRPVLADLCCGHGLTGVLFALFERRVEEVVLLDQELPRSHERILDAAAEVGPWVGGKLRVERRPLQEVERAGLLPPGAAVVAVHACGSTTDRSIEVALATGGPLAVMPCCYGRAPAVGPAVLRKELGRALALDIQRTIRLEEAGRRVEWAAIPSAITPMNRILLGLPRGG